MLTPESDKILVSTPLEPALQYFVCGLCDLIVQPPYPQQCCNCHAIYCE